MRVRKRISKRISTRQRNRIQKRVAEHHRKTRKVTKNSKQWRSKKPKDLGIPNSFPFKEQVLAEREAERQKREEERNRKRKGLENGIGASSGDAVDRENNDWVMGVQADSEDDVLDDEGASEDEEDEEDEDEDQEEEEDEEEDDEDADEEMNITSSESEWEGIESEEVSDIDELTQTNTVRNAKPPPYIKAITRSDLVIFVLDARAPLLTRSPEIEQLVERKGKEAIFVLNRAERIPSYVLNEWINLLSETYSTYPFISQVSNPNNDLSPSKSLKTLKSMILKRKGTTSVVGIPRIGKSTLINSLLNNQSRPRSTVALRSYDLAPKVTLLDTPALPFMHSPVFALLGIGKPSQETIDALLHILSQLPSQYYTQLESKYAIPALVRPMKPNRFVDATRDLLVHVARKFGRLGKKGLNLDSAAEIVGEDCLKGDIEWFINPH